MTAIDVCIRLCLWTGVLMCLCLLRSVRFYGSLCARINALHVFLSIYVYVCVCLCLSVKVCVFVCGFVAFVPGCHRAIWRCVALYVSP